MTVEIVNAPARCWPCECLESVSGLRGKKLDFFEMHTCHWPGALVLKYGSDINEVNCLQLLFLFIVLMGIIASVSEMSFFQLRFKFWIELF